MHTTGNKRRITADKPLALVLIVVATQLATACVREPVAVSSDEISHSEEVYFGPRFRKDRVTVYRFRADNMSVQTQAGQSVVDANYTESIMRFTVSDVHEDGSADLMMTYDRLITSGESAFGGTYAFDSTQESADPETDAKIVDVLRKLTNSTVKFRADALGNVDPESVVGTQDACEVMQELMALQARVAEFNSAGLAKLFESTWRVADETYTRDIGKPWQDVKTTPVEGLGYWTFTSNYQTLDRDPRHIVLGVKLVMSLEFQPPEEFIPGMLKVLETEFEMIKGDFRYVWDRENFELVERTGELEFNWRIMQEGLFQDEVVRTDQHQHVTTSLQRIDE